ncbi:MAG: ABC transporter ATP-binding protein [Firmicutes bacterium]|nr:ABC transporter ATP-binding protein [Bacillota bacterium]MDD4792259.1 ABC transporter ATP-binding protein [Bacillota bacterium]
MSEEKRPRRRGPGHGPMGAMMPAERARDFKGSLKRLSGYLKPHKTLLVIVAFLSIASVVMSIAGPKILGRATNILFEGVIGKQLPPGLGKEHIIAMLKAAGKDQMADMVAGMNIVPGAGVDFAAIARVLITLVVIYIIGSFFSWLQHYIMAGISQRTVYGLRKEADAKLARLPLKYYDSNTRGEILSRVTNDIDNIAGTLQQSLTQLITATFTVIGVLIMMFSISPLLALIALATLPLSVIVTLSIARRSQKQFTEQWDSTGALNGHIEEMFTGHNIVKAFNRQGEAIDEFNKENGRLYQASFKAHFISSTIQPAMRFINNLNYVAVCVLGGMRVANGTLSLGDVQAFIQYSRQFTQPIVQTASIMNVLQSTVASAERVFELLDEEEEAPDTETPVVLKDVEGHVAFDSVAFRYKPDVPLIEDMNLEVEPGQTVAIVGPTGAGKTTVVNLLMRFYELDGGSISIDGVDIRDMARNDLRRLFGMVLQDTWLFNGTIRDNIAYGREDATEAQIMAAAHAAHVDHFVRTLPDGYDTELGDEASNISQGQKQLLTIARAFLADPEILILDEATSSVDTRTEVLIQKAMAELMRDRTSFVIAHRLSTVRNADTILVMDNGSIVEQGNHAELMAARGFYYDLYNSQFAGAYDEAV